MAAICLAWDWNIPPDINTDHSSPMRIDSPEMQISDIQMGKTTSEKENRLIASLQSKEDAFLQKKREDKIKKSNKSLIDYQAIQTFLKTEIQTEVDKEIQAAIGQQLELLKAILEYKNLGKKEKLNIKLQKQVWEIQIPTQIPVQIPIQQ